MMRMIEDNHEQKIELLDPVRDLKLRDLDLVDQFDELKKIKQRLPEYKCTQDPMFDENVRYRSKCVRLRMKFINKK